MLVLTRKADETIKIGEDVEITVIRVRGNSVRIGIKAPKEIRVTRGELDIKTRQSKTDGAIMTDEPLGHREFTSTVTTNSPETPRGKKATKKMGRVNRIASYRENDSNAPRRIIMGRTTRDTQQSLLARGPLTDYLQNL